MNLPRTYFLPLFFVTAIGMTLAVIVAVYAARTAAVERGIAQARDLFRQSKCDRGFSQLARISRWANCHPALVSRLRCTAIIGHVRRGDDDAAAQLAKRMRSEPSGTPRPTDVWEALFLEAAHILDPLWLQKPNSPAPDSETGYKTMQTELRLLNDARRLANLDTGMPSHTGNTKAPPTRETPRALTTPVVERPTKLATRQPMKDEPKPSETANFGAGLFAVVCGAATRTYGEDGKHTGELAAGSLLNVSQIIKSTGGDVAVCRRENDPDTSPPMLVRTADLSIRTGDIPRVPPPARELLVRHGQIESELRQQRRAFAASNPHAKTYKKATDDYKAFVAEVQTLTTQRDAATGSARVRLTDELHTMKNEEPILRTAYENSKRQYTEWKVSHSSDATSNPQAASLQTNLAKVTAELAQYDL